MLEEEDHHSTHEQKENESSHEMGKLRAAECRVVVPESQRKLTEDGEFALFQVLLLERGDDEKTLQDLQRKEAQQKRKLKLFCKNTFSETFTNWIHLKMIRTFVESVLRFGLPV